MVNVTYHRDHNRVTVEGHARSAEYGHDLICAAVSALTLTLTANVEHMADADIVTDPRIHVEDGIAEISYKPRSRFKAVAAQTVQSICVGFEILATKYPDYVSWQVMG